MNAPIFLRLSLRRLAPQPLTALVMCLLAAAILAAAWANTPLLGRDGVGLQLLLVAVGLAAAVVAAGRYPIHLQYRTKVLLTTVPLYLAANLLPPAMAALSAGLGVLVLQLIERKRKGSLPSDMATAVARWVIVAALSSWAAHWAISGPFASALTLLASALIMLAGDIVTGAFESAPMSGEPPL